MYKQFGINEEVIELAHKTEEQVEFADLYNT